MKLRITEIRKARNVTQAELAKLTGISRPYINQIERQTRNVSAENLSKIAQALNVAPSSLICDESSDLDGGEDDMSVILRAFREAPPEQRSIWLAMARAILDHQEQDQ